MVGRTGSVRTTYVQQQRAVDWHTMARLRKRGSKVRSARVPGQVLRQVRIGPRLLLAISIPSIALLGLIGLLISTDVAALRSLRNFETTTEYVERQIDVRADLQLERHLTTGSRTTGDAEQETASLQQGVDEDLRSLGFVGGSAFLEDLQQAREFAENNQRTSATLLYTDLISALEGDIEQSLRTSPLGLADQRSTGLRALLAGEESLLLEDLETRQIQIDPIILNQLHTSAVSDLSIFSETGSPDGVAALEQLTVSSYWRTLNLIRLDTFNAVGTDAGFDRATWTPAAQARSEALAELVDAEASTLRADIDATVDGEYRRLGTLAAIALTVLALAMFTAFRLRRSIVAPLSILTVNARRLSRGEPASTRDSADDEIGEMSRAFASISSTIEHLWGDVDRVADAVAEGDYDRRIATDELAGDWLRLAETMNATLDTGAEHRVVVREELDRRGAMAQISNAAAMASTAPQLTAAVLAHLPSALAGSHTHLHLHPSGPPTVDLGIPLEPTISALELPTVADSGQLVNLRNGSGIAALVEFPEGPPAVLVLAFGYHKPAQVEPLISLVETAAQILAQAHRRQAAESRALHDREHDILTGLPNATFISDWFGNRADRSISWSIIGIQPQRLDELDGLVGRTTRNLLVKSISDAVAETVSSVGIESEVVLARITDPDFAVIAPSSKRDALTKAIARRFAKPITVDGHSFEVRATLAHDRVALHDRDLTQTITNVAAAIAQAPGRETEIIAFEASHRELLRRRSILIEWLAQAIEHRELSVHFQPIVNAITTNIEGYEVLVRAKMDGKPLSPAEFIPVAEDTGMITEIGQFVLREACAAIPFLRGNSPYVAVNLSPIQLSDPDLLDDIERILTAAKAPRDRVIFEVTEGATATPEGIARLTELRDLGVRIAIDDFGSGQSNLSYLNNLPAQILKLDRSLVTPMIHDEGAATLVQKTIEMAHALDMTVIGEGVETHEQLNALRRVRCDRIQGWFTGKPAPLQNFIEITVDRTTIATPEATEAEESR